jgi:hypothetical protein
LLAALVGAATLVVACGGSSGGSSTLSSTEMHKAHAFLDTLKPPPGFTPRDKDVHQRTDDALLYEHPHRAAAHAFIAPGDHPKDWDGARSKSVAL